MLENDTMWLRDTGVLNKIKDDGLIRPIPIPLPKVWKDEPLNLYQLGIIMIVFVFGMVSSICIFLFEVRKGNKTKKTASNEPNEQHRGTKLIGEGEGRVEDIEVAEEEIVSISKVTPFYQ